MLMALSRERRSGTQRDYSGRKQPNPGTSPLLLSGDTHVSAAPWSGNIKSTYTRPRTNDPNSSPSASISLSCPIGDYHLTFPVRSNFDRNLALLVALRVSENK